MKTKKQIEKEIGYGKCYTSEEFREHVVDGYITSYDGMGYFHNGEEETDIEVFSLNTSEAVEDAIARYPYVMWYNK